MKSIDALVAEDERTIVDVVNVPRRAIASTEAREQRRSFFADTGEERALERHRTCRSDADRRSSLDGVLRGLSSGSPAVLCRHEREVENKPSGAGHVHGGRRMASKKGSDSISRRFRHLGDHESTSLDRDEGNPKLDLIA